MAESGSWSNIREHGLLSTSALLDLFGITGEERDAIESHQRRESIMIGDPPLGPVVIRDQIVLNEKALRENLDGMSVTEYFRLLNGKVFFWVRRERLERLLNGKQYRNRAHDVLTVDTRNLILHHYNRTSLSPINSGAFFGSGRRGVGTFKRIDDYPFEELKKKQKDDAVVELAVDYAVKDISRLTVKVERWIGGRPVEVVWDRPLRLES
jgi:hypothetical protein